MEIDLFDRHIFTHSTPSKKIFIEKFSKKIDTCFIDVDKDKFNQLCHSGCVNYGSKYSCPPFSPSFNKFIGNCSNLDLVCYKIFLNQYSEISPYNRIRASNSILKSIIDKELLSYKKKGFKVAGSGSCRACKPCGATINLKCKKPDKIIYSLESLGVDVCKLIKENFDFELEWHKKGRLINYTCVVGGIIS